MTVILGRVGRLPQRKPRTERKKEVHSVVTELQRIHGYATIHSIAKRIGKTPSTHLRDMLWELYGESLVDTYETTNSRGHKVYHWTTYTENYE